MKRENAVLAVTDSFLHPIRHPITPNYKSIILGRGGTLVALGFPAAPTAGLALGDGDVGPDRLELRERSGYACAGVKSSAAGATSDGPLAAFHLPASGCATPYLSPAQRLQLLNGAGRFSVLPTASPGPPS